jgi:hypothetical protein
VKGEGEDFGLGEGAIVDANFVEISLEISYVPIGKRCVSLVVDRYAD